MVGSAQWFILYTTIYLSVNLNQVACNETILELREKLDILAKELKKSKDFVQGMTKHFGALSRQVMLEN